MVTTVVIVSCLCVNVLTVLHLIELVSGVVTVVIVSCLCVNVLTVLHLIEASEWRG